MTNKERILSSIRYIEGNLKSEIDVPDIARESCCSYYHFIRLFQSTIGISPKKYLLQRRLTESVTEIQNSGKKIIVIAFDFQFGSHEVYTRSFQKQFGIPPYKVRNGAIIPAHLLTKPITTDFIFQSKKARNHPPELVEREAQMLVGVSYFINSDLKKLDLTKEWNAFMRQAKLIGRKTIPENYIQIQYWSEDQDIEGMFFFIGTTVQNLKDIHPQFVVKIIPKGMYLKFVHQGLSRNVRYTYRYIYQEFLPNSAYRLSLPFNFECYGKDYLSPCNEQSESSVFIPVADVHTKIE